MRLKWDALFIDDVDAKCRQSLYDLTLTANCLGVDSLLHLCCAKVACLIKGQPLEKIKEILASTELCGHSSGPMLVRAASLGNPENNPDNACTCPFH
jgi:hypothetical protein